jgi:hypothetical protein
MKDFKLLAAAHGLDVPEHDLARISDVLTGLEAAFRPLVAPIPLETEPALTFTCPPEEDRP